MQDVMEKVDNYSTLPFYMQVFLLLEFTLNSLIKKILFKRPGMTKINSIYQRILKEGHDENKYLRCPYIWNSNCFGSMRSYCIG